jgi:DNA polymerase-3 subunit alpha
MLITIFDTETTGLIPKMTILQKELLHKYPHVVQLSYLVYDTESQKVVKVVDKIIRLDPNINISQDSVKFHKITRELSTEKGVPIAPIIQEFFDDVKKSHLLVAHNYSFDWVMIQVECMRLNIEIPHIPIETYCTMKETAAFCKIPSQFKKLNDEYKWPTLFELYVKLFNELPENLHNSLYDVYATLRCLMKFRFGIDVGIL